MGQPHAEYAILCLVIWCIHGLTRDRLGNVEWVDQPTALADNLAYINPAGNAILRVDNATNVLDKGADTRRNTVRLSVLVRIRLR